MNIKALLAPVSSVYTQPTTYDSTSSAHVATSGTYQQPDVEQQPYTGPPAPTALHQRSPATSQRSVPPGHHALAVIESESNRVQTAGQSNIKIMIIKDGQGRHVEVPVDVMSCSKAAYEKRKRNAAASQRFRERRKEKERETSMKIAHLG
ncbi:hypothetical protein GQ44DRAFT_762611 [Phaeosphaeriaceae sp. PMI808]|nr:hypothetical protein GQ44DRAFT_762611 [Phaeosphaeriaceae sp. PMI808]